MAQKPKEQAETNEFNMPTEFDDQASQNAQPTEGQALSLDDLDSVGFNNEEEELQRAKLNPPAGDWLKIDKFDFRITQVADDCQPGDINPTGRTLYLFSGKPESRAANGIDYEPMLFIRMSPDLRNKQDKDEIDNAYKLFLKGKDIFLSVHDEMPSSHRQLVEALEEEEYLIRTLNGDSGPFVIDIKPKRVKK